MAIKEQDIPEVDSPTINTLEEDTKEDDEVKAVYHQEPTTVVDEFEDDVNEENPHAEAKLEDGDDNEPPIDHTFNREEEEDEEED